MDPGDQNRSKLTLKQAIRKYDLSFGGRSGAIGVPSMVQISL